MSHTYEKVSGNKAKLTFTVPAEQFDEAMQKAYLKMRGRINVPGFRKGKAPRSLIERMYGEGVFYEDAFDLIFPEIYQEAVKAEDIHPVDQPNIDIDEIGAGQDLKFHLEVFVRPDVELGEYKGLSVEAEQQKVTDAMIDARAQQNVEEMAQRIQNQGISFETYLSWMGTNAEDFTKMQLQNAEKTIRQELALAKIAELEGLTVTEEDKDAELQKAADQYGVDLDTVKNFMDADMLTDGILYNKAADLIIANATALPEPPEEEKPAEEKAEEKNEEPQQAE